MLVKSNNNFKKWDLYSLFSSSSFAIHYYCILLTCQSWKDWGKNWSYISKTLRNNALEIYFYSFSPLKLKACTAETIPEGTNRLSEYKHSVRIERSMETEEKRQFGEGKAIYVNEVRTHAA